MPRDKLLCAKCGRNIARMRKYYPNGKKGGAVCMECSYFEWKGEKAPCVNCTTDCPNPFLCERYTKWALSEQN